MPAPTPYYNRHGIVAHLRDGRVVAYGEIDQLVSARTACFETVVRVPDLKYIEHVLDVEFSLDGFNCTDNYLVGPDMNKKTVGNLVGMTIYIHTTGQTLHTKVIAVGPP